MIWHFYYVARRDNVVESFCYLIPPFLIVTKNSVYSRCHSNNRMYSREVPAVLIGAVADSNAFMNESVRLSQLRSTIRVKKRRRP